MTSWKPNACENEPRVVRCARTGFWDSELQQHVRECRVCAEAASIARLLNDMRRADDAAARIPDSSLMWRKAQFLATRDASERATQPISFVERFAYAVASVCLIAVCFWQWHAIRSWFAALGGSGIKLGSAWMSDAFAHFATGIDVSKLGTISGSSSVVFLSCGVGLLALCAFVAAYVVRAED
ncbi:MAG TPA: hypothetical protein VMF66_03090 [Candidatus Acidoferrum sp.]|nr:hypothetical protein [Candidatus Acidoferrum sp.]